MSTVNQGVLRDNEAWQVCKHHGMAVFSVTGKWRRCQLCQKERDRVAIDPVPRAHRLAVEDHQHRHDEDYWGSP